VTDTLPTPAGRNPNPTFVGWYRANRRQPDVRRVVSREPSATLCTLTLFLRGHLGKVNVTRLERLQLPNERHSSPAAAAGETLNSEKPKCRRGQVQRLDTHEGS
jgi:hypothetical protein